MPTMDVTFKNPFYHGKLGLLAGKGDEDTVYVLDDREPLPRTALVRVGVSQDREARPERAADAAKAAVPIVDADDVDLNAPPPRRVKPREGAVKGSNILKPVNRR